MGQNGPSTSTLITRSGLPIPTWAIGQPEILFGPALTCYSSSVVQPFTPSPAFLISPTAPFDPALRSTVTIHVVCAPERHNPPHVHTLPPSCSPSLARCPLTHSCLPPVPHCRRPRTDHSRSFSHTCPYHSEQRLHSCPFESVTR